MSALTLTLIYEKMEVAMHAQFLMAPFMRAQYRNQKNVNRISLRRIEKFNNKTFSILIQHKIVFSSWGLNRAYYEPIKVCRVMPPLIYLFSIH